MSTATAQQRPAPALFHHGDRFSAYVAHELRTPLATQRVLLELALTNPNADLAGWREVGADVLRACKHQERLLEACLALARCRQRLDRREAVDLAAILADALRTHDLGDFKSDVVLDAAWTTGSPELLERLVANLVSNAIRHNTLGGRVELATRSAAGRAVLSVANTGPRIRAAEIKRLFEPFQRLSSSPGSFDDGVGLGLAIVQAVADAHRATVAARPRTGGGLAIDVTFRALK